MYIVNLPKERSVTISHNSMAIKLIGGQRYSNESVISAYPKLFKKEEVTVVSEVKTPEIKEVEVVIEDSVEPEDEIDIETEKSEDEIVSLESMSKEELDIYAEERYNIKLDRRKSKAKMLDELYSKLEA